MKVTKRTVVITLITLLIGYMLALYQLPYYIYKPGGADSLDPVIEVDGGYNSEGDMHLVTVSGGPATPLSYMLAKILPYHEINPIKEVIPDGISEEDYMNVQLHMMGNSQQSSTVVAYKAAGENVEIKQKGVYVVDVIDNMSAEDKLESGDEINKVDDKEIKDTEDLLSYVDKKKAGDIIRVRYIRNKKEKTVNLTLQSFKDDETKIGVGIQLVTNHEVEVDQEVTFSSGKIGGPSAGLMFALEIYDQLTKKDLTRGKQIIGTGEIDYDGNVLPIGGIDKKVVAADKEGGDIFFAPNKGGAEDSNYKLAKKTADAIETDMVIVPVDTFQDALDYLKNELD